MRIIISILFVLLAVLACSDKFELPSEHSQGSENNTMDTNYVPISPVWSSAGGLDYSNPSDIVVGRDGLIYIADTGNDRVVIVNNFGKYQWHVNCDSVKALCVDSRLNVFMVNGSPYVFRWNQFSRMNQDHEADTVYFADYVPNSQLTDQEPAISSIAAMPYGVIAEGNFDKDLIIVGDEAYHKIIGLKVVLDSAKTMEQGEKIYDLYYKREGNFVGALIAEWGSGAGTTEEPVALWLDSEKSLYIAQDGGSFQAQKLSVDSETLMGKLNYFYTTPQDLFNSFLFQLELFKDPFDVSSNILGEIFVTDPGNSRVWKFSSKGDSLYCITEDKFDVSRPQGIYATDKLIFVTDGNDNKIKRFRISVFDENILPEDELN